MPPKRKPSTATRGRGRPRKKSQQQNEGAKKAETKHATTDEMSVSTISTCNTHNTDITSASSNPSSASPILQRRKQIITSPITGKKNLYEVVLEVVECHGGIFLGYLMSTGKKAGSGYWTKPIDDALQKCTEDDPYLYKEGQSSTEYPSKIKITDLMKFHYFVPRRLNRSEYM